MGQTIPEPFSDNRYSGKIALRTSRSLHRDAVVSANREGVSLNQFITIAIAEKVGASKVHASTAMRSINTLMIGTNGVTVIPYVPASSDYSHHLGKATFVNDVIGNYTVTAATTAMGGMPLGFDPMSINWSRESMAEITKYDFSLREVVEALIKQQGLHSGIWKLIAEFGLGATNIGPNSDELNPAAIIPLVKLSLAKTDEITNLAVDASKVNPPQAESSTVKKKKSKTA